MKILACIFLAACGTTAAQSDDYYYQYYEEKAAVEHWEENHATEVYMYETGEIVDVGDLDAAEVIEDYGLGERLEERPETYYYTGE